MTNDEYQAAEGISASQLHAIAVSPLNYWDQYVNPDREPREEKHCFSFGTATHTITLEPEDFHSRYFIGFDKTQHPNTLDTGDQMKAVLKEHGLLVGGTKAEMAERLVQEAGLSRDKILMYLKADHDASNAGKEELAAKDYKDILGMLNRIQSEPAARGLINGALTEQSFFWHDGAAIRKCRPDIINGRWTADLKTTQDINDFERTILKRRYHVAAAWYLDILAAELGNQAPTKWAFIATEKARPYDCGVFVLSAGDIDEGRDIYHENYQLLLECKANNHWPGKLGGKPKTVELPKWRK